MATEDSVVVIGGDLNAKRGEPAVDVLVFKLDRDHHDFGEKTFLGRTGPLNGEDIIDTILAQRVTGVARNGR